MKRKLELKERTVNDHSVEDHINPAILELIPFKLRKIRCRHINYLILETDLGDMALWIHEGREANLALQLQILKCCQQKGLQGFLYPVNLQDGRSYARFDERGWFFLTPWPDCRKVSFRNLDDLTSLIKLISAFRGASYDLGLTFCLPELKDDFNLLFSFEEGIRSLNSFFLLARYRLRPTRFDRLFSAFFTEIVSEAELAYDYLKKSAYSRMFSELTTQNIIIYKLTRGNLRLASNGDAFCLHLSGLHWDLPIIDFMRVLVKTGRFWNWSSEWFNFMCKEYEKYFRITAEEQELIFAYLTFPWNLYRLSSIYYYNQAPWSHLKFDDKIERLFASEDSRIKLLAEVQKK